MSSPDVPPLRLNGRDIGPHAIMAVVNRTPDSFYDRAPPTVSAPPWTPSAGLLAADIVDIGGVKASPGDDVGVDEELRRVVDLVAAVREHPRVVISVDTWRAEVGEAVARAGADLLNDTWGGPDPRLAGAAAHGIGLVCAHAALDPRTRPHRVGYGDVVADVIAHVTGEAERAAALGCGATRSSSTRRTTSARTPASPWRSPGGWTRWPPPDGRYWSRCPTRTSSARRSAAPSTSAASAPWPCSASPPCSAPASSASTTPPPPAEP